MTIAVAFTVDYSAGKEKQRGVFGHAYSWRLAGCVGEESEGESCGGQFSDSRWVAEKGGGVSGIGVAERSELLVVTGNEGRARVDAAAHINQSTIDPKAQFGHGVGFVDVTRRKQLLPDGAEDFLGSDQKVTVVLAAAGNIEEPDQNAFIERFNRTYRDEVLDGGDEGFADRVHEDGRSEGVAAVEAEEGGDAALVLQPGT